MPLLTPRLASAIGHWTLLVGHAALLVAASATSVLALDIDRDWPSVTVAPSLDVPLRDTCITRGPDGSYYLTGTPAATRADGTSDFANGRQLHVWRSPDLRSWTDLGVVWDLENRQGDHELHRWQGYPRIDTSREPSVLNWGITAPELHAINGDWFICLSVNDAGIGLLKSTSGKPEGPYVAHSRLTVRGGSPSLFQDDIPGRPVYLVYDGGWIARLNADLTALAETPRLLVRRHDPRNEPAKLPADSPALSDAGPVGRRGAFMFKQDGRYYLTAADDTPRLGIHCDDTFIAHAASIYGPYSERQLMIPHGGGTSVFIGPDFPTVAKYRGPYDWSVRGKDSQKTGPQLYASFFGADTGAAFRDRPTIIPLEWSGHDRFAHWTYHATETFPRRPQNIIVERGPWAFMRPLFPGKKLRDMKIHLMPDGFYYLMGSTCFKPGELILWRSADLVTWTELPPLWTYRQVEWLESPEAKPDWFQQTFWDTDCVYAKGTYYLVFNIYNNENTRARGVGVLRSKTGKIEGPYESLGRIGGQLGKDPGPIFPFHLGTLSDGSLYVPNIKNWRQVIALNADPDTPNWKLDYQTPRPGPGMIAGYGICEGGSAIYAVGDRWFYQTVGNGTLEFHERRDLTTYDINYWAAEGPFGPPRGPMRTLRHLGAGRPFQDKDGNWWHTFFGDDHTGPWWQSVGLVPLRAREEAGDLVLEIEDHPSDAQKRVIGAGEIQHPPTVLDLLAAVAPASGP